MDELSNKFPNGSIPSLPTIPTPTESSPSPTGNEDSEVQFPEEELGKLDEMINRPQWIVPVLAKGELEVLLEAAINLCKKGLDTKSEACQVFFREGLSISFTKIYTNEAVNGWKPEIQKSILHNSERLVQLCVLKLDQDWFPLLDLLAIVFNPHSKFHLFNCNKSPERPSPEEGEEVFAQCPGDHRPQKGWLVDLINLYGSLDGFKILSERFQCNLSIPVVAALLRPFGYCSELLSSQTLQKYFLTIINTATEYLEGLTDDELKRETKNEAKNDTLSCIINSLKCLVLKLPEQEDKVKRLEMFRLEVIFRLLQISSFNGKMNALNEINKLVTSVSYNINKHPSVLADPANPDWLSPEKIAEWIESKNVLSIVLRDSLHQPQYVEKLEKIIRFMIKEKALSLNDLDMIWEAQIGKHLAIVKNVHDLLAKLAWDFLPQQLDHLFGCFQASWSTASKKQREKLLALIRRLAEDDKEGIMAPKVLSLLWSLAKSHDVTADIMDQALTAHIKILDYSCSQVSSQGRDNQKLTWVGKFVDELKEERMVIPAIKQIREICQLFTEAPHNFTQRPSSNSNYRNNVISYLHTCFHIVKLVSDSLDNYMIRARQYAKEHPDEDPNNIYPDGRFNHYQQVNERLKFLRFLLKDGQLWLCKIQANQIWRTLAENAIYPMDRENCFRWFSKVELMGDEPDLDPEITNEFFQQYILKFDPVLLTQSGLICFERFFHHVNCKEGKLSQKRRGGYVMEDLDLVGVEYLWRVVSYSWDEVADKAIMLLKDTYTSLGNRLQDRQVEIHEDFVQDCMNRLQAMYDTVTALRQSTNNNVTTTTITTATTSITKTTNITMLNTTYTGVSNTTVNNIGVNNTVIDNTKTPVNDATDTNTTTNATTNIPKNDISLSSVTTTTNTTTPTSKSPSKKNSSNKNKSPTKTITDIKVSTTYSTQPINTPTTTTPPSSTTIPTTVGDAEGIEGVKEGDKGVDDGGVAGENHALIVQEASRMIRVLTVLKAYIAECDETYNEERAILPLHRASRGKSIALSIRFMYQGRQGDEMDCWSHSNETIGCIRRQLANRYKGSNIRVELGLNNEVIDPYNDRKLLCQIGAIDKLHLTAKYVPVGLNNHSSPDSSSASSTGSLHNLTEGPNMEAENCLPGVLLAGKLSYTPFLFSLSDLGSKLNTPFLRDAARDILRLMPLDFQSVEQLRRICTDYGDQSSVEKPVCTVSQALKAVFFGPSASQVLYSLELVHALLIPATNHASQDTWNFQYSFILSGGIPLCLQIISSESFLPLADACTKKSAYLTCLRILKLLLPTIAYGYIHMVAEAMNSDSPSCFIATATHAHAVQLQKAFQNIPSPSEAIVKEMAVKLGKYLTSKVTSVLPDQTTIKSLQNISCPLDNNTKKQLCTNTSNNNFNDNTAASSVTSSNENIIIRMANDRNSNSNDSDHNEELVTQQRRLRQQAQQQKLLQQQQLQQEQNTQLSKECLEVLTFCLALSPSQSVDLLCKDKSWHLFIITLLIKAHNQEIRESAQEQFYLMATCCSANHKLPLYFITLLFTQLSELSKDTSENQTHEYFQLLCRLLNYACSTPIQVKQVDALLTQQINWLKKIRLTALRSGHAGVDESLIEGHLSITKELLMFQSSAKKYLIGTDKNGHNLIKELVEDFLFTSSRAMLQFEMSRGDVQHLERTAPICQSPASIQAAFNLLISLVQGCLPNLKSLLAMLSSLFHSTNECQLLEWEYMPPINAKPPNGFVGLKNAGATCYMNSVLQQLFMIEPVRKYILSAEGASSDEQSADEESDDKGEADGVSEQSTTDITMTSSLDNPIPPTLALSHVVNGVCKVPTKAEERKDYNLKVLKYVQYIFAHLSCSKMQFYVPKGFWKHFRLQGEPVNLREQHDALEFFNSLVDSLDEALKSLGYTPILTKVLGGSFADQKICKDCPHRYSREESFTVLNIDIRNQENLLESLEQYVKGDLLEGANAYHCDKCNKKVDTVKRLCIKKLPPTLAIQLKRFDYDWERECAIKFNDYFEFPRQLDMMPYTVQGLAEAEGEHIVDEDEEKMDGGGEGETTTYNLVGVVVHSGQASGGHYFSYILHRSSESEARWYKFDDGDVSEFKMDDDDEMKNHCFGGDYMGEVFDHMLKRMHLRRQKRWWNAYILFYEKATPPPSQSPQKSQSPQPSQQHLSSPLQSPSQQLPSQVEQQQQPSQQQPSVQQQLPSPQQPQQPPISPPQPQQPPISPQQPPISPPQPQQPPKPQQAIDNKAIDSISKQITDLCIHNVGGNGRDGVWRMPVPVEMSVRRKNIKFLHDRCQYSLEYFRFMKQLLQCNTYQLHFQQTPSSQPSLSPSSPNQDKLTPESEEMALCTVQLVSKFLFNIALHTKKCLRGPASEWFESLFTYMKHSRVVRQWFAQHILFSRPATFSEFLLEAPSTEIRNAFMRMLVFLVHFSQADGACPPAIANSIHLYQARDPTFTLGDHIIFCLLALLKKDGAEHNRHLGQYLHFFITYLGLGVDEKRQLLNLNVAELLMMVAQEDSNFTCIKYPGSELNKLYSLISQLVRCCDVTSLCSTSFGIPENKMVAPNPYRESSLSSYVMPVQMSVVDILFNNASFVKRTIQDCNNTNNNDEVSRLLKFCSWENPTFSSTVLSELLCQITYTSSFELRPHLELLHQLLLIEDSWQNHRIHNTLKGITEERDGLFDTIQASKLQNPKRSYQCIKMLVSLFRKCAQAENMLMTNIDLKQRWVGAVEWLQDEIEKRNYPNNSQFAYGWSNSQSHSNETSNSIYLERTNSAKATLHEAMQLCPEYDLEETNSLADDTENNNTFQEDAQFQQEQQLNNDEELQDVQQQHSDQQQNQNHQEQDQQPQHQQQHQQQQSDDAQQQNNSAIVTDNTTSHQPQQQQPPQQPQQQQPQQQQNQQQDQQQPTTSSPTTTNNEISSINANF